MPEATAAPAGRWAKVDFCTHAIINQTSEYKLYKYI